MLTHGEEGEGNLSKKVQGKKVSGKKPGNEKVLIFSSPVKKCHWK